MLTGTQVILRPPLAGDADFLHSLRNDFTLQTQLMALPRANSAERVGEWVRGVLGDPASVFFIAASPADDRPLGFVQVRQLDHVHGTGELGICFAAAAQGSGAAAGALDLLEAYLRDTFGTRKLVLRVLGSNTRAIAFYRRQGYAEVGTHRQHFYHRRAFHDVLVMEKML
jgi:diamine N-acetyltransferase